MLTIFTRIYRIVLKTQSKVSIERSVVSGARTSFLGDDDLLVDELNDTESNGVRCNGAIYLDIC